MRKQRREQAYKCKTVGKNLCCNNDIIIIIMLLWSCQLLAICTDYGRHFWHWEGSACGVGRGSYVSHVVVTWYISTTTTTTAAAAAATAATNAVTRGCTALVCHAFYQSWTDQPTLRWNDVIDDVTAGARGIIHSSVAHWCLMKLDYYNDIALLTASLMVSMRFSMLLFKML